MAGRIGRSARAAYEADRSYVVASVVIVGMAIYFTAKQRWGIGLDIWEHAAAVRELMARPFSPRHPSLALDAPHQLFTPYHLAVALFGRLLSLDVTTAMSVAGIANLVLVLVGLRMFVRRLSARPGVAALTLVFTLFVWGGEPWSYSGFLHSRALWLVLAYPATFATGLALVALALFMRYQDRDEPALLPLVSAMGATIAIAHQVEALVLYGLAAAFVLARPAAPPRARQAALLAGTIAASAVVALGWPYFSLWDLSFATANEPFRSAISHENLPMYIDSWGRTWLATLAVPFLVVRLRRNPLDPIVAGLVVCVGLYAFGWHAQQYLLGRTIAMVVLLLHLTLADAVVEAAAAARRIGPTADALRRWLFVSVAALVVFGANLLRQPTMQAIPFAMALPDRVALDDNSLLPLRAYRFLARRVGAGDIVLAEGTTSFIVPAMSDARVVAVPRPLAFVRSSASPDVIRFFDAATPAAERRAIIAAHGVTDVLVYIPVAGMTPELLTSLTALGTVTYRDDVYALVNVA